MDITLFNLDSNDKGPMPRPRRLLTPAQLAARRRNAQKSTGPRTEAGKRRSRLNALKRGLCSPLLDARIRFEGGDPALFRRLGRDLACVLDVHEPDLRPNVRRLAEAWWPKLLLLQAPLGSAEWLLCRKADEQIEQELSSFVYSLSLRTRNWRHHLERNFGPQISTLRALRLKIESRLGTLEAAALENRDENSAQGQKNKNHF